MTSNIVTIRTERQADHQAVEALLLAAFDGPFEANLVRRLRDNAAPILSLVAESADCIVGHILFTPVRHERFADLILMGLAPMAVAEAHRDQGIGGRLVREGLDQCRSLACAAVIVLGHPTYYPRFGFRPASHWGITCQYDAPDEAFLAQELIPGVLRDRPGKVHYHPAFNQP